MKMNCDVQWLKSSKHELIQCARQNLKTRIDKIIDIVQRDLKSSMDFKLFILKEQDKNKIINNVSKFLLNWKGVDLKSCSNTKQSYKEYHETSINWFNRNKSKIYGNLVFYPILFTRILNVCIIHI